MPAFDAYSGFGGSSTGSLSWNHEGGVAPNGVTVIVVGAPGETFAVTFGGEAMSLESSHDTSGFGEGPGVAFRVFRLSADVPAGAQGIVVTHSGSGNTMAGCWTDISSGPTEVQAVNTSIDSASQANPSFTLGLDGADCLVVGAVVSGQGNLVNITPLVDWVDDEEIDLGSVTMGFYRYSIVDSADVTVGWAQSADDAAAIFVAVRDPVGGDITPPTLVLVAFGA